MILDIYNASLTNSDLWEVESFVIRTAATAQVNGQTGFYQIDDFVIPIFERSRVMAASFDNSKAEPHWKRGCYLKQSIPSPGGVSPDAFFDFRSFHIPLNSSQIFFPLSVVGPWQLRAAIPRWHEEAQVTVYRFTGTVDAPLAARLTEIENKINSLIA